MLLTVKALQGRECSLQVSPEESVGALKALVAERLQVPVEQQRLLYRGKALADERRLSDYRIGPSARLNLVLKAAPAGGGARAGGGGAEAGGGGAEAAPATPPPQEEPGGPFGGRAGRDPGAPFWGAGGDEGPAAAGEGLRARPARAQPGRARAFGGAAAAGGGRGAPPPPSGHAPPPAPPPVRPRPHALRKHETTPLPQPRPHALWGRETTPLPQAPPQILRGCEATPSHGPAPTP
ncbi:ubiquitin-like protein 4A isoform X1 [Zonotrichia albicollis]|uniref:ubiquitin-like protein 4A isoform X1 n=1 Tax=Zonotrichia albicollis TaxID=44394 RepID=UPI003D81205F